MKYTRELKVGLFGAVALALFLGGLSFLKGYSVLKRPTILFAKFDNVDMLTEGANLFLSGYQIGSVKKVSFVPGTSTVLVEMRVIEPVEISVDAIATVYNKDLVGTKAMRIIPGKEKKLIQNGDTLKGALQEGVLDEVKDKLTPVIEQVSSLVKNIDAVMVEIKHTTQDSANRANRIAKNLETTMDNAARFSDGLPQLMKKVNTMVDSLNQFAAALKGYDPSIKKVLTNAGTLTDTLAANSGNIAAMVTQAKAAVGQLKITLDGMNRGEGTLGKLLKDEQMYANLNKASKSLDELLVDLQANPKRYVHFSLFGRKDKPVKK